MLIHIVMRFASYGNYSGRRTSMKSDKNGFTLIEVVVVICIIGILTAIAIPTFSGYRERAKNANALADLKQIRLAVELLASDTSQWPNMYDSDDIILILPAS